MQTATTYKIRLDNGSKKFPCPQCGKKTFVKMKDYEAGQYLPDHVGRCDRENNCGYHFTLKQYSTDIGTRNLKPKKEIAAATPEDEMVFLPLDYVKKKMTGYMETNFAIWLISLFGGQVACTALREYFVGRAKDYDGQACIFWRIDKDGQLRTGKVMFYNAETGKRNKERDPYFVHSRINGFVRHEYQVCFFGEHLITEYPEKVIGIVESEKTAIIASIYMPDLVWIATGGNSGCKWREWPVFKVLKDREIIFFPDFGFYNKKTEKTCWQEWSERAEAISERMNCKVKVSQILEDRIAVEERINDYDLADMLIKKDIDTGIALTDFGYPVIWDLK